MIKKFLERIADGREGFFRVPRIENGEWKERLFHTSRLGQAEKTCLKEAETCDLYFSPALFAQGSGKKRRAFPTTRFLWLDIDEGDHDLIPPTILWQTSPGRFSGIWELEEPIPTEQACSVAREIAHYIGGDKGGWDITQVLRVPGTINHKKGPGRSGREKIFFVREDGRKWTPNGIAACFLQSSRLRGLPACAKKLSPNTLKILKNKHVSDRSKELCRVALLMFKDGLNKQEVAAVLPHAAYNKYRDRPPSEQTKIFTDIVVSAERMVSATSPPKQTSPQTPSQATSEEKKKKKEEKPPEVFNYKELMLEQIPEPEWLVRGWWHEGTYGIVAGHAKSYKSFLTTDFALALASGGRFLGEPAKQTRVLMVQIENSAFLVQQRLRRMAYNKRLEKKLLWSRRDGSLVLQNLSEEVQDLPLHIMTDKRFEFPDRAGTISDKWVDVLNRIIDDFGIQFLIIDPLYLASGANLNDAFELRFLFRELMKLNEEKSVGIMVVHHNRKAARDETGKGRSHLTPQEEMLGSTTLGAFTECAWYTSVVQKGFGEVAQVSADGERKMVKKKNIIQVRRQFRGAKEPPMSHIYFDYDDNDEETFGYTLTALKNEDREHMEQELKGLLDSCLRQNGGRLLLSELVRITNIEEASVIEVLRRMDMPARLDGNVVIHTAMPVKEISF